LIIQISDEPDTSRARLIAAAARLFQERGYAATGLADILKQAGAPKGSLYHHFPGGKAQLTAAAMRGAGGLLRATLQDCRAEAGTAAGAVERFSDRLAGWLEESEFRRGCPMATVALECTPDETELGLSLREGLARTVSLLAEMIEAGGAPPERARDLAEFALAALEGAMILARAASDAGPVRRAGHEAAALINRATA
jgi:TetR/AcrR family transcriptional repressor of lmrAB and yxaGH operons